MILHKLATVLQFGGALLTLPAGLLGIYSAYQVHFSTVRERDACISD